MQDDFLDIFDADLCDFCGVDVKETKDSLCEVCRSIPLEARELSRKRGADESDFDHYNKRMMLNRVLRLKHSLLNQSPEAVVAHGCLAVISMLETSRYDAAEKFYADPMDLEKAVDRAIECYRSMSHEKICEGLDRLRWSIKNSQIWERVHRMLFEKRMEGAMRLRSFCTSCGQHDEEITMMGTCNACALVNDAIDRDLDLRSLFKPEDSEDEQP